MVTVDASSHIQMRMKLESKMMLYGFSMVFSLILELLTIIVLIFGIPKNLVLIDLILFLLLCRDFTREFTLLFLLEMFSIDFISCPPPQTLETDRCLNQQCTVTEEVRLPLVSLSRGKATLRLHALLHLLVQFHLPRLAMHLDSISSNWWKPYSYPLEKQDDFVSVRNPPDFDHRTFQSKKIHIRQWKKKV